VIGLTAIEKNKDEENLRWDPTEKIPPAATSTDYEAGFDLTERRIKTAEWAEKLL